MVGVARKEMTVERSQRGDHGVSSQGGDDGGRNQGGDNDGRSQSVTSS